jgi:hypothetical protein
MKTDTEIKRDVEAELRWDPEIDDTDVAVTTIVSVRPADLARALFLRRFDNTHTPCGGEDGYP